MSDQLSVAFEKIDAINLQDPNRDIVDNVSYAKEYLYSQRMRNTLAVFQADASEALQVACYAQHIGRWQSARKDYPQGREGYKQWRKDLGAFHAKLTSDCLQEAGYLNEFATTVADLLQKKKLKTNPDTQALEDVICLVFLEFYLDDFANKHSREKMINILQKTWHKMSDKGHQAALELKLSSASQELIANALA